MNALTFGDPLYFLGIQKTVFQVTTVAPWTALANAYAAAMAVQPSEFWATVYLAPLAAYIVLALTTLWTVIGKGGRPSYAVYTSLTFVSFAHAVQADQRASLPQGCLPDLHRRWKARPPAMARAAALRRINAAPRDLPDTVRHRPLGVLAEPTGRWRPS